MTISRTTLSIAARLAAILVCVAVLPVHAQQAPKSLPSVSLTPAETQSSDPNLGAWFVFQLAQGQTTESKARITNVAEVPMHVKLYLADLVFSKNGTPEVIDGPQKDVGAWGAFHEPEIIVPAKGTVESSFRLAVPKDAEPGDHVGVVVAESDPEPGGITVVKRVATRLYVTVPGDARRSMEIESFSTEVDSKFWPRQLLSKVLIRNTGRIRIHPKVSVRDTPARGSDVLLARSLETYVADVKVPWYGGPVRLPVEVTAESGLTRRLNATKFVIPWALLVLVLVLGGLSYLVRKWWMSRASRLAQLHADIRRLETLVTKGPARAETPVIDSEADEERAALIAGLKRSIRTRSQPSLERLALALHETGEDALEYLMEALREPSEANRKALIDAAASYGPAAVATKSNIALPDDVGAELIAAVQPVKPQAAPKAERTAQPKPAKPRTAKPKSAAPPRTKSTTPPRAKRKPLPTNHKPKTKKPKT